VGELGIVNNASIAQLREIEGIEVIAAEAALNIVYIIRISVDAARMKAMTVCATTRRWPMWSVPYANGAEFVFIYDLATSSAVSR
jgi:hypothetical protein